MARIARKLGRRFTKLYFEIKVINDKVSALKIYCRQEIKKLAQNLPDNAPVEDEDDFKKLIRKLNNHFLPNKNKQHARYMFSKRRQELGESIVNYSCTQRDQTRDTRKAKSHQKRKSRKQLRQTPTQAANQIANTISTQHDMSYIKQRN